MPDPSDERTRRLSLRIDKDLKRRVDEDAERRGQSLRVYVERALEKALSEASVGALATHLPVEGASVVASTADAVKPAAPSQASGDVGTPLPKIAQRRREW
jgi:predicted DNA-binding protein